MKTRTDASSSKKYNISQYDQRKIYKDLSLGRFNSTMRTYVRMLLGPFQNASRLLRNLLKPSLSMKILSNNNFTTKLLSKLVSDLYIGVHF